MKKILFVLLLLSGTFLSCKKETAKCSKTESTAVATTSEIAYIQNYLTTNSLTATQHPSGVFYEISMAGTGASPSACSYIGVEYQGTLFNGQYFDGTNPNSPVYFTLGDLIPGWQRVLPVLKAGGMITLYIPPSLGYGNRDIVNNGTVVIPANSYLKFVIKLTDVQ